MGISLEQLTNSVNKVITKVKDKFVSKEETIKIKLYKD